MPRTALTVSPLCSIPLPVYPRSFDGPRRWSGVRPEAMWHPLLWLPSRIANRYQMSGDPSDLEDDDLWSVRVALEMSASGLYDDSTGTWVDILALVGIDIDSEQDIERVDRWLRGANDPTLDGLGDQVADLIELTEQDRDWAAETAADSMDGLRVTSWALTADSLFDIAVDIQATFAGGERRADLKSAVSTLANLAYVSFLTSPHDPAVGQREQAYWQAAADQADQLPAGDDLGALELLGRLQERLATLRDHYWPLMQEQAEMADAG